MPIDLRRERLLPLKILAARFAPLSTRSGKCLHASTILRWCLKGRKRRDGTRVYLESIRSAGGVFSTRLALVRFLEALDDDEPTQSPADGISLACSRHKIKAQQIEKELDQAGL